MNQLNSHSLIAIVFFFLWCFLLGCNCSNPGNPCLSLDYVHMHMWGKDGRSRMATSSRVPIYLFASSQSELLNIPLGDRLMNASQSPMHNQGHSTHVPYACSVFLPTFRIFCQKMRKGPKECWSKNGIKGIYRNNPLYTCVDFFFPFIHYWEKNWVI